MNKTDLLDEDEREIEENIDFEAALPETERLAAVGSFRKAAAEGVKKSVTTRLL